MIDETIDLVPERHPVSIGVYVVDGHRVVREGLIAILSREPDIHVVGAAAAPDVAIEALKCLEPAVVVINYRLIGPPSAIDLCRLIRQTHGGNRVVMLSPLLDKDAVDACISAGASAYVLEDVEARELKRAIRAAASGKTLIDSSIRHAGA